MKPAAFPPNRRILVIDDNPAIHDDFGKISRRPAKPAAIEATEAALSAGHAGETAAFV